MEWNPTRDHDGSAFDDAFELVCSSNAFDGHYLCPAAICELLDIDAYPYHGPGKDAGHCRCGAEYDADQFGVFCPIEAS